MTYFNILVTRLVHMLLAICLCALIFVSSTLPPIAATTAPKRGGSHDTISDENVCYKYTPPPTAAPALRAANARTKGRLGGTWICGVQKANRYYDLEKRAEEFEKNPPTTLKKVEENLKGGLNCNPNRKFGSKTFSIPSLPAAGSLI